MIQLIADKYKKPFTYLLFVLFYLQTIILPLHAAIRNSSFNNRWYPGNTTKYLAENVDFKNKDAGNGFKKSLLIPPTKAKGFQIAANLNSGSKVNDGGPTSPEASTFKAVGSDNLVNLFTGDFSYSIPCLM